MQPPSVQFGGSSFVANSASGEGRRYSLLTRQSRMWRFRDPTSLGTNLDAGGSVQTSIDPSVLQEVMSLQTCKFAEATCSAEGKSDVGIA